MEKDADIRDGVWTAGHVVVPEVWGDGEDVALEKLRRCGLLPGRRQEEPSRSFLRGSVFGTIPPAGTLVKPGERISYVVSIGSHSDGSPDERRPSLDEEALPAMK